MPGSESVSGTLSPALGGATITVDYTAPDSTVTVDTVTTQSDGSYTDSFQPMTEGAWSVQAHFAGNQTQTAADSPACSFTVTVPS